MCGRFAQSLRNRELSRSVTPQLPRQRPPRQTRGADTYKPSFNVAPMSYVPVVRCALPNEDASSSVGAAESDEANAVGEEKDEDPMVMLQVMKWGLLPPSQKAPPTPKDTMNTINARDDVLLAGSPLWSRPFSKGQRCIVFVQGFYEWLKIPKGAGVERIAHFVGMSQDGLGREDRHGRDKALMPLAGLWEKSDLDGESELRYTFTIITTDSASKLNFLHDRQPLILPNKEAIATWLDPKAPLDKVRKLVVQYTGDLDCYKVPREVGKVGNSEPSFILPVEDRKDGLMAAFGRAKKSGKAEEDAPRKADKGEVTVKDANSESNAPVPASASGKGGEVEAVDDLDADQLVKATEEEEAKHKEEVQQPIDSAGPSSRFSPDPFNPPLSPKRPNGGYSTDDDPHGGLSKYGTDSWQSGSSPSRKRQGGHHQSPPVKMGEGMLEQTFKRQKVKQEERQDFMQEAGVESETAKQAAGTESRPRKEKPSEGTTEPRSPSSKQTTNGGSPARKVKKDGSTDIRSFFGKSA